MRINLSRAPLGPGMPCPRTATVIRRTFIDTGYMIRDRSGLGWIGRILLLTAVVGIFWGLVYPNLLAPPATAPFTPAIVETGDFVEVDYIGWFPDTGRTFDTSIEAVARDNATYPKAASFSYRAAPARYQRMSFVVGCTSGPDCPIKGFQDAILGVPLGETARVLLPPSEAYGPSDPAKIEVRPLLQEVQVTETLGTEEYLERFFVQPRDGQIVLDPTWKWNVTVRVSGDLVTIRNSPDIGQTVRVGNRWDARVVSIDDGASGGKGVIRLQHLLTAQDVNAFVAGDAGGNFIVVALDGALGTYTVDYNPEVVGKTLGFEIAVKALQKGSP